MQPPVPESLRGEADKNWSLTQKEAWQSVEAICERIEQEQPFLDMNVPDLLRIVELLSYDLGVLTTENIPGSHIITINDVLKGHKMVGRLRPSINWY